MMLKLRCLTLWVLWLPCGACLASTEPGLLGHWKLAGDCRDYSGRENHGVNHGADLADPQGAIFDGVDDYIEVPAAESLALGRKDFSFAVWIHTAVELDDVLGDILSKYDPATRTGITFAIMNYAGVASAQSNYRNLSFGIDAGRVDPQWTDCGRPGNSQHIWALTVYDGHLYAGTWEPGADEAGHVYRYEGGTRWTDCGAPDRCNSIETLAVYRGKLYAGSSSYSGTGSALPASPNQIPGGTVYRYEGGTQWADCGRIDGLTRVSGLTVFGDRLYASTNCHEGKGLYRYEGDERWSYCGNPGRRVVRVSPYNGYLYATTNDGGQVARFESSHNWTDLGTVPKTTQLYSYAVYRGGQYCATWPFGLVFRHEGEGVFKECGRLGNEREVMPMAVYNGKLYAGTLPLAQVYRYDGQDTWTLTGRLDHTPEVKCRRVWAMAVFDGRLFAGTLPSGHVYSLEAGKCVTHDRGLVPGWRHLTAVKAGDRLKLYVDGKCVDTSEAFDPIKYDLSNRKSLLIGFGEHDYFNGRLRDLRIYERALSEAEIGSLSKSP